MGGYIAEPESGGGQRGPLVRASVLLTDNSGNVLLVRSADADTWTIPSAAVAGDEAPHDCVERLVAQQLGLTVIAGPLLVIGWRPAAGEKNPAIVDFMFDGGEVFNEAALAASSNASVAFRFFSWKEAESEVPPAIASWLHSARNAREDDRAAYLPSAGEP